MPGQSAPAAVLPAQWRVRLPAALRQRSLRAYLTGAYLERFATELEAQTGAALASSAPASLAALGAQLRSGCTGARPDADVVAARAHRAARRWALARAEGGWRTGPHGGVVMTARTQRDVAGFLDLAAGLTGISRAQLRAALAAENDAELAAFKLVAVPSHVRHAAGSPRRRT